ncbi:MAG: RNA methyltransferase [Candidatus Cloacimonetes bacterium]|jgi:hypothetical protein|nr:RNA methyltransferase [Candidatus Cloacimonadota bacterium]MDD4154949.1 RNA methyltransferase [Candidatus Cloacimonadota bacterium]
MTNIYIGLVHYPVYNKAGEVITSGITNLDVHDISRSALSYNVKNYFLIHPNQRQKEIFNQILGFWKTEMAAFYNQHRVDALSVIKFAKSIDESVNLIKNQENNHPIIITTTAQTKENQISFYNLKELIKSSQRPIYLLFGTGNGLCEEILNSSDYILSPIQAKSKYNHLSVRSAVAIVLDRLLSEEYKEE